MRSAHLDYIGVNAEGEDRIYNGAVDNALGVTSILEAACVAFLIANDPERPAWNEGDFFGETFGRR